jgi:pimeloyl-ACP methyl ester carboxylesterase
VIAYFLRALKRALKLLGAALLAFLVLGALFEAVGHAVDKRRFPPPGQLVDVDGYEIHLQVAGEEHDGPTVVVEAGLAATSVSMAGLQSEIAPFARVVTYDRAGLGWSGDPPRGQRRDAQTNARVLHEALVHADIPPPYLLVAHSMGALNMLVFADEYEHEVMGVVLVDPSHPEQFQRYGPAHVNDVETIRRGFHLAAMLGRFGIWRMAGLPYLFQPKDSLARQQAELLLFLSSPRFFETSIRELDDWQAYSIQQVMDVHLGDLPLIVLSASATAEGNPVHGELQRELTAFSSNSGYQVVDGATHGSILSQYAPIVAEAVRSLLAPQTNSLIRCICGLIPMLSK